LEKADIKRLDMLVRLGIFKNRSQAIRSMLREELERKGATIPFADLSGIAPVVKLMLRLASQGVEVVQIRSARPAGEIVGEGRQRL